MTERRYGEEEVGIEPAQVAHAAQTLDARGRAGPVRRSFGLPIGTSRAVDLPRAPTDREWEQLITEFRTTFGSPGSATRSGALREWAHGDMHICVEPTEHGEELRLRALHYDAMVLNGLGIVQCMMSTFMAVAVAAGGKPAKALAILAIFGGIGVGAFAVNLVRLPRWTREREQQMEAIAEHAVALLANPRIESQNDDSTHIP